ncbi:MAG: glycosyltransferase [Chloroflexi bacterium]|nr:glycosyltransferase [Chloroflexota bacterium]MBT3668798.1 glycosyltransferase [Chloroflexota bacterium]MBT4003821.1 glycosyltransferase [Chloroflexota bacterium]MBT4306512.1 glycosyltransferase [Chloroflexota bacterium]MBT4533896.1 glycosyltransferase [Chloroflexota bacterium]
MVKNPLVSVLMTSYNQENFIEEAMLSVVQQDYENLQIVVSDDGSTDKTPEILKKIAQNFPERLEVYLHNENSGSTKNYNFSLSKCRGEYICYLDGDDVMFQGKISKQLKFMLAHPEYILSYHNVEVFESDTPNNCYLWDQRFGSRTGTAKEIIQFGNFLPSLSIMFRKNPSIFFNENISLSPDWLYWIDLLVAVNGEFGYIDQVMGRYRRHKNNLTLAWTKKIEDQILTLSFISSQYPQYREESKKRLAEIFLIKSLNLFRERKIIHAMKTFFRSLKLYFPNILLIFRLPLRESVFFLRSKMKTDNLIKSLFIK